VQSFYIKDHQPELNIKVLNSPTTTGSVIQCLFVLADPDRQMRVELAECQLTSDSRIVDFRNDTTHFQTSSALYPRRHMSTTVFFFFFLPYILIRPAFLNPAGMQMQENLGSV
jgi:hypothetical protein